MINVAIVEDDPSHAKVIEDYLEKYGKESGNSFGITKFSDGLDIVDNYKGNFDIVFLDIQMKHLDGMSAAQKIRGFDQDVVIIFITSTVQYAVQGYTVDALGYVLKPVPYGPFSQLIDKACIRVNQKKEKVYIKVPLDNRQLKLECDLVTFIESQRNNVIIHTTDNTDYTTLGPLKKFEEILEPHGFSKCHNAYLINLSKVDAVKKEEVILKNGVILPISRARKKEFMADLASDIL